MPLAAASEKEGKELGTPQTPAGGLRPPAPLLKSYARYRNAISLWHKQYTRIHMLMSIVVLNRLGQRLLYTPGCG